MILNPVPLTAREYESERKEAMKQPNLKISRFKTTSN